MSICPFGSIATATLGVGHTKSCHENPPPSCCEAPFEQLPAVSFHSRATETHQIRRVGVKLAGQLDTSEIGDTRHLGIKISVPPGNNEHNER